MGRTRSHWGWGWAERFPDRDARAGMAGMVRERLGFDALSPEEPRPIDSLVLPPPRVEPDAALAAFSTTAPAERARHAYGRGYFDLVRGLRGEYPSPPDIVARPRDEADVVAALEWAAARRVAVVPFGGGTSVVGGVEAHAGEAFRGVVSLDMEALGDVREVDTVSRLARIGAGAYGPAIEAALAPHGLSLRHYPQSFEFSTLGGWIATRAGGHFATLYTHIDDLVAATRMITPAGVFATGPLPGDGAGPAPDRLVAGSEGAFGVITEAWMRVHPRPRFRARASVHFDDFTRACAAARALAGSGLYPTNCRLLEAAEAALNLVADDGSHVLIVGFESADHPLEPWLARALELCADHGGTCPRGPWFKAGDDGGGGAGAEAAWRQAFVDAPYLMNTMVSLGVLVETCETACSWRAFPALDAAVRDAAREVMDRVCGGGRITCRFTHVYPDGPAPYYTLLAPARRGAEREQWRAVKTAVCDAMLATGGTITHHHAVGRTFRPWYERQRPPAVRAALAAVKASLDPAGIMNPGVLLETGGGP